MTVPYMGIFAFYMKQRLDSFWKKIKNIFSAGNKKTSKYRKKAVVFIDKNPFRSFFVALGILVLLIIISNLIGAPKPPASKKADETKNVHVYSIGSAPKITVQAQVEKSGTIRITALTPGVIQNIFKNQGENAAKGETLIGLSTNYQGGNSASLGRQLAQTQYKNALDTYDTQKELIKKQKELADKNDVNADELRNITSLSLGETRNLITLNEDILKSLDENIAAAPDSGKLQLKQLKSQFLAATNQARQGLRNAEFAVGTDNAPAALSNLSKDTAFKQLELQEKMLDVNREISRIQLNIAQVTEAMMFPSAPFNATVQRVFVKVGQQVNPGTELMVLSAPSEEDPVTAIAYVSADVARKVSQLEESTLYIGKNQYRTLPSFVTTEAIQGSLYGVYFDIPDHFIKDLTEKGFIQVELPIGYADTASVIPYVPIDAVYQTKDQNYVFVAKNGKAEPKSISLGEVYGSSVEVIKGLGSTENIILNRNIIAGDKVNIQK